MTEKIDGKENLVYQFQSNKIHYYVYTQISNITNNEKELLEFIISEKFSNYYKTTHSDDVINRILKDDLNKIEIDIISKHMWPLTFWLPKYKESWIVQFVDKLTSLKEILHI